MEDLATYWPSSSAYVTPSAAGRGDHDFERGTDLDKLPEA